MPLTLDDEVSDVGIGNWSVSRGGVCAAVHTNWSKNHTWHEPVRLLWGHIIDRRGFSCCQGSAEVPSRRLTEHLTAWRPLLRETHIWLWPSTRKRRLFYFLTTCRDQCGIRRHFEGLNPKCFFFLFPRQCLVLWSLCVLTLKNMFLKIAFQTAH